MRLIYLYTSIGSAAAGSNIFWDMNAPTAEPHALSFPTEGHCQMLQELIAEGTLSEVLVFMESARQPGVHHISPALNFYVVPEINQIKPFIKEGDVFYVRGGFKSWYPFLEEYSGQHWMMFYAAASQRGVWPFWDVVLNDLIERNQLLNNQFHFAYAKPTHEDLFFHMPAAGKIYDVIINASHIHDRKAQWKVVHAAVEYKKLYGRDLVMCLPGRFLHGVMSNTIPTVVRERRLKCYMPGMVERKDLNRLYNQSRLYVNLGSGGQNDRGSLEALRCGVPALVAYPRFFAPCVLERGWKANAPEDPAELACDIHRALKAVPASESLAKAYLETNGLHQVVLPRMRELLAFFKSQPTVDRTKLEVFL